MRFGFSKGFQWVGKQKNIIHTPYAENWSIIQINYYGILYFNTQSIQKISMLIKYLVYVNGSNQRTTPKEITTWFPFSDISNPWNNPKDSKRGLFQWQGAYQHQTEEEAHQGNVLIWNWQGNFQLMQPQLLFFPDDFRCSFIFCGEAITKKRFQDIFHGRTSTTLKCIESRHLETCAHANCSKSMYCLKLRFNKSTVCFWDDETFFTQSQVAVWS